MLSILALQKWRTWVNFSAISIRFQNFQGDKRDIGGDDLSLPPHECRSPSYNGALIKYTLVQAAADCGLSGADAMERSRSKDHPMLEGQHHVRYAGTHDTTETNVLGGEIGQFASTIHSFKDEESSNDSSARHLPSFQRRKPTMIRSNRQSLGFFRHVGYLVAIITSICITPTSAVLVEFQNCLSNSYRNDAPLKLQLVPMFVNAVFNSTDSSHNLNVTVYTNVTGSTTGQVQYVLPPSNDTAYWTSNDTTAGGKIEDNPFPETVAKYTTLTNKVDVLTYTPYSHDYSFCTVLAENGYSCPLAPVFNVTG